MIPPQGYDAVDIEGAGDISIWESFEYISDAALQAKWIKGGGAGSPARSTTAYYGQHSMSVAVAGSIGTVHRALTSYDMSVLANLTLATRSDVGGETIAMRLYDSNGYWSEWNLTLAAAATWKWDIIYIHATPDDTHATSPVDLADVVKLELNSLDIGSTFLFDLIEFESLVASKIGIGYDGLDDAAEESSSVRGHLLLIRDEISDAGITTFPAAANIGNGVSLAEAIRAILTSVVGGDDYDAYTNISGSANASMDAIAQKFAVLFAADGANTFNPTIQGAAKTDLDVAMNALAAYFAAGGAAISATVNPGGSARATLELILEDMADMLAGATGIVTYPAGAAAGDGVSMAEAMRYASEEVDKVPKSDGAVTWNGTALAAIEAEAEDALEGENLDHLQAVTTVAADMTAEVVDGSVISRMLSKTSDTSTYNPTTDAQEMISDKLGGFTGGGGVDQADSTKASLDLAHLALAGGVAAANRAIGKLQIAATTIELNQAAATYLLFTGTTQAVVLEKLVFRMPNVDISAGALTSISIQTDDNTPAVIISAADGIIGNLTEEATLSWTGAILIPVGTLIRLTIAGGLAGACLCDVVAESRAVVNLGYLS